MVDDLEGFLAHQKALAEMPEGDIEDYEKRLRLRAKRRKLWKAEDERATNPGQKEREEAELLAYLQTLEETSHNDSSSSRTDTAETRKNELSGNPAPSGKPTSNSGRVASSSRMKTDPAYNNADTHQEDGFGREPPSKDSFPPSEQRSKVSNNRMASDKERVVKNRKAPDLDDEFLASMSNITSPSKSSDGASSPTVTRVLRPKPTLESKRQDRKVLKAQRDKEAAERKKQEEMEKRMTPREYAAHVQTKFTDFLAKKSNEKLPLRGKAIFYAGGDYSTASQSTRKKMDHLRKKGATVVPVYDPKTVTHIITDAGATVTLKALGLKSLNDIPMYIPTLTWSWVTDAKPHNPEFLFAAFPSRIDASSDQRPENLEAGDLGKSASKPRTMEPTDPDYSRIEDFSVAERQNANQPPVASSSKIPDSAGPSEKANGNDQDPLAAFYDQARKEAENATLYLSGRSSEGESPSSLEPKSKWTCDNQPVRGACVNQDIVDKLSELEEINKTKMSGDPREQRWRVFSYGKSIRAIRAHSTRIRNYDGAISIRGVGKKTADKVVEIIKTGDLERIKHDNTDDVQAIRQFNNIYGVGLGTAQKWYTRGCMTLDDVRERKGGITLTDVQELGLKYYDDINSRIPRGEVEEIFNMVKSIALGIDPKLFFLLMGSYRRGAETCGDIDILMTRPIDDGKSHRGVLRILLKELHRNGILTEDLAIPDDFEDLDQTYRGLCRRDENSPRRRIDILAVPWNERGGALIYYTGDDIFNRAIRLKAKSMGYSLSQHGLSKRVERDSRGKRMVPAELIASETEEEIFRVLGVPWQEPHERIRAFKSGQ